MSDTPPPVCTSADEIVKDLLVVLPPSSLAQFAAIPFDRVVARCHHGLGQYIRNRYFWPNPDLITAIGVFHADDASTIVMEALWHCLHTVEAE